MRSAFVRRLYVSLFSCCLLMGGAPAFATAVSNDALQAAISQARSDFVLDPTPENADRLATLLERSGNPEAALHVLEETPPETSLLPWHERAARLAELAHEPLRAMVHLQTLYQARPEEATGRRLLAAMAAAHAAHMQAFAHAFVAAFPAAAPWTVELALGLGRRELALQLTRRWMDSHPRDPAGLHQLAQALVRANLALVARRVYERLLATSSRTSDRRAELRWREEWLAISSPADDVSPGGQKNLEAALALDPNRLEWRRRLAVAYFEQGEFNGALGQQRLLAASLGAVRSDRIQLARWLVWAGRLQEGLTLYRQLDGESPLGVDELGAAGTAAAGAERWTDAAYFFARRAEREPQHAAAWRELAQVDELRGDATGSADAWHHLGLVAPATESHRIRVKFQAS